MQKRILLLAAFFLAILLVIITVYRYFDAPRRELLTDVNRASSIIVDWHIMEDGELLTHAFRLDAETRIEFGRKLTDDLGVDFVRRHATVTPSIGLYLTDDNDDFLAYYAIRYARGGGTSHAMENLREFAKNGERLTDTQKSKIYHDDLRSKWPHAWRFDYTLPVTYN